MGNQAKLRRTLII